MQTQLTPVERVVVNTYYVLVTPRNRAMPVWIGPPGGGKTDFAAILAAGLGVPPADRLTWIAAQHGPEDFNGWQVPRADGLHSEAPYEIKRVAEAERGFILLDEFSNMPRATQAGALRFVRERRCGETILDPTRTHLMAAMNPAATGADVHDLSHAMSNRSVFLDFPKLGIDESIRFMSDGGKPRALALKPFDSAAWESAYPRAVGIYSTFLRNNPDALYEDPESDEVQQRTPLAYCTPRSLEAVVLFLATFIAFDDLHAFVDVAVGTIGGPKGAELAALAQNLDLMDPDVLIDDPEMWTPDPRRPDRTFAQLHSVAMASATKGMERWIGGWKVIDRTIELGEAEDLCILAAQHLVKHMPKGALLQTVKDTIKRIAPLVNAAVSDGA